MIAERKETRMAKVLKMTYYGSDKPSGFSLWKLSRKDGQEIKFPHTKTLTRIWGAPTPTHLVLCKRSENSCVVEIPARIPREKRDVFLRKLEQHMKL